MQPFTKLYTDLSDYYDLMCADIDYQAQSSGKPSSPLETWDGQSGNALFVCVIKGT